MSLTASTWSGFNPCACLSHIRAKSISIPSAYCLQSNSGDSVRAVHTLARIAFRLEYETSYHITYLSNVTIQERYFVTSNATQPYLLHIQLRTIQNGRRSVKSFGKITFDRHLTLYCMETIKLEASQIKIYTNDSAYLSKSNQAPNC